MKYDTENTRSPWIRIIMLSFIHFIVLKIYMLNSIVFKILEKRSKMIAVTTVSSMITVVITVTVVMVMFFALVEFDEMIQ